MSNTKSKINGRELLAGFLAGIVGGTLTWLVTDYLSVKQKQILSSSITVDSVESLQGKDSLRMDFALQPAKRYLFSPTSTVGGIYHLEAQPDNDGLLRGIDLSKYDEIVFYAKASAETFTVNEFNLFVGSDYIQYTYNPGKVLVLTTKWAEYRLPFSDFKIAPWESTYRSHLIDKRYLSVPNTANITGLGFDLKTADKYLSGQFWVDYVRVRQANGIETMISDGSNASFQFMGHDLRWVASAREHP